MTPLTENVGSYVKKNFGKNLGNLRCISIFVKQQLKRLYPYEN